MKQLYMEFLQFLIFVSSGVADMEKCIYPSLDSIKACTGSVGGNDFEIVKSAVSGAIRYACHNKGERIKGSV